MRLAFRNGLVSMFSRFRHENWMPAFAGMTARVDSNKISSSVIPAQAGIQKMSWKSDAALFRNEASN